MSGNKHPSCIAPLVRYFLADADNSRCCVIDVSWVGDLGAEPIIDRRHRHPSFREMIVDAFGDLVHFIAAFESPAVKPNQCREVILATRNHQIERATFTLVFVARFGFIRNVSYCLNVLPK